jgi:beta-phosphoglucomutase family hydrolase
VSATQARPVVSRTQSSALDALAGRWWAALETAEAALRTAGPYLGGQELGEHSRRLSQERSDAVQLLQGLAHDRQTDSPLLDWLAAPAISRRLLGLPDGVIACVFDLDGVLTTSASVHAAAWADTFDAFLSKRAANGNRQLGRFDETADYESSIAGRSRLDGVRRFLASRGISLPDGSADDPPGAETVHGLANGKNEALRQRLERQGVAAFEGSRCYLEAARTLGLRRAVVSASANTETILERAGLAGLVEERVDGNVIEAELLEAKPAPDTLLFACQRLQVQPAQSVAFETTSAGISAARAAGFRLAIGVERNGEAGGLLGSDADVVVGDLAELLNHS